VLVGNGLGEPRVMAVLDDPGRAAVDRVRPLVLEAPGQQFLAWWHGRGDAVAERRSPVPHAPRDSFASSPVLGPPSRNGERLRLRLRHAAHGGSANDPVVLSGDLVVDPSESESGPAKFAEVHPVAKGAHWIS